MAEKDKKGKNPNAIQVLFRETLGELRKVSWPTRQDAIRLTGLVLMVMVVVGILLAAVEAGAAELFKLLLGS